ncbi:MAG: hypothetical protein LIO69_04455 [Oscillospiraceae bacterium]|nr:hypothetical protein [Oscillospiraceae bacterium]
MDKVISICSIIVIVIIGFIVKLIRLHSINKRLEFTSDYRNKFIQYVNQIASDHTINQTLYYELTSKVKEMQMELGEDGVFAYMTDNLRGITAKDYQLLLNFLPETREMLGNSFLAERYTMSINSCDDMFIRHIGSLNSNHSEIRNGIFNPFSNFAEGIKSIILLPFFIFSWCGFITLDSTYKLGQNIIVKILNAVIVILGLIGTIITIVLGWSEFTAIVMKLFE